MAVVSTRLETSLRQVAETIDTEFDRILAVPNDPRAELYKAMRHAAIGGGKRLRPILVFATSQMFGVPAERAARVATALESIHVYSLVHDDLPAMDDDDMRRGKPTVHKAFNEAAAILAGDCLHALAFEILAEEATHPDPAVRIALIASLARSSGPSGMGGGQMMDLAAEKASFDLETVTRLQDLKTGALIACAVESGAILGGQDEATLAALRTYAHNIGLAFQIADDILDAEGDEALAGKKLRKDGVAGKETFISLLGLEPARERAKQLIAEAIEQLDSYGSEADLLRDIAHYILARDH